MQNPVDKAVSFPTAKTGLPIANGELGQENPLTVGSTVGQKTLPKGFPNAENGQNHAQNDSAVGNVGNVGKIRETEEESGHQQTSLIYDVIQRAMTDGTWKQQRLL
jgi:hypothetical protein